MIHLLSNSNSVLNRFIYEMRSVSIQTDAMRFRINMERVGEVMAYELSKMLKYEELNAITPLGESLVQVPQSNIVLASVLRAGLPMHNGFLRIFDNAENAFISAYRQHHKDGSFEIKLEYLTCPTLNDKVLILVDPMLATGASLHKTLDELKNYGTPQTIHIVSAIASRQGMNHMARYFPNAHLWIAALDEELTAKSFIVPGLGDAGDLAFGSKLQE